MYAINGIEVSESDFLAHEDSIVSGKDVYIRPVYRNAWFVGFCVYVRGEAVGKVFDQYKHAAQLREQIVTGELS